MIKALMRTNRNSVNLVPGKNVTRSLSTVLPKNNSTPHHCQLENDKFRDLSKEPGGVSLDV